jgi:hypothetical protein
MAKEGNTMLSEHEIEVITEALRQKISELAQLSRPDLLASLPKGNPRDQWDCPLARRLTAAAVAALGDSGPMLGVRVLPDRAECFAWDDPGAGGEKIAIVPLPDVLTDFVCRFDDYQYPQLTLEEPDDEP